MDRQDKDTLKTLIRKAGLNYETLAERIGTNTGHISQWNLGKMHMRFNTACKVARELGVTLEELADSLGYLEIEEDPDDDRL